MELSRLRRFVGFVACVTAVFVLPYLFPPHSGISLSTMAGFSNRAAQVVLLGGSLLFALWTRGWGLSLATLDERTARPWRWAVPALAVTTVTAISLYLWHWASNVGPFDEGIYFLDRFSNQLAGGRVYRDFTFDYGPLLYYPSWWIAAALRIPVGHAYYLFFLLEWVIGVLLLWRVIGALRGQSTGRVITFTIATMAWLTSITDQGAQYTPLRFVLTSGCAVWVFHSWQRRSRTSLTTGLVAALAVASLCFVGLLLYSPEQAIGFALATVLFFAVAVGGRAVIVLLAGFAAFCLLVFAVAAHLGLLQSLFTFAGGAFNLPVLPSGQTVFLISMLLAAACMVVHSFRFGESARREIYLIALALASIPAALGRADAGHIFINTMPALIVITLALLQRPMLKWFVLAGWGVYLCVAYAGHTRHQVNVLMHSWPRVEKMPDAALLPPAGRSLRAPIRYFSYLDGQFGPRVVTGRYYGYDLVFPGLAELKIAELEANPRDLLVIPVDYGQTCQSIPVEVEREGLHKGLMALYTPKLKAVLNVKQPLCDYIHTHYMASPYRVPREEYRVVQPRAFPVAPAFQSAGGPLTGAPEPQATKLP